MQATPLYDASGATKKCGSSLAPFNLPLSLSLYSPPPSVFVCTCITRPFCESQPRCSSGLLTGIFQRGKPRWSHASRPPPRKMENCVPEIHRYVSPRTLRDQTSYCRRKKKTKQKQNKHEETNMKNDGENTSSFFFSLKKAVLTLCLERHLAEVFLSPFKINF
jgi:hypothetical protein